MLTPYPDQIETLDKIRDAMRAGHRRICLRAPTGAGKTVMFSIIARSAAAKGKRVILKAHRAELIDQICATLDHAHGVIMSGEPGRKHELIQVASTQTLVRRLEDYDPDLIIDDECQHEACETSMRIARAYPRAMKLGVTATTVRGDGKGLRDAYDHLVLGPTVPELLALKRLCPTEVFIPKGGIVNRADIGHGAHEFLKKDLAILAKKRGRTGDFVETYRMYAEGRRTLIYGIHLEDAQNIADTFNSAGYRAARIDGTMKPAARRAMIADFRAGRITHLTSVSLVGEGFDLPGIEAQIDGAPTMSLGWLIQKLGRGMRVAPGKLNAVYIDLVNNCGELGHHPNMDREWTLDGTPGPEKNGVEVPLTTTCDACYRLYPGIPPCPYCAFMPVGSPRSIEHYAGELQRLNEEMLKAEAERTAAIEKKKANRISSDGGLDRLLEKQRENEYKIGWVKYQILNRRKHNPSWGGVAATKFLREMEGVKA